MADFILKEIDQIGVLLRGILRRLHLASPESSDTQTALTKVELVENLGIDIDTLLDRSDFIEVLITEYHFDENQLELFAEVLADMAFSAETAEDQDHFGAAVSAIYKHQDAHKATPSINRFYILEELVRLKTQREK